MAGFLFNSHIPPTTLTLDIVMAGFILFVRLSQQFGGGPPKPSCYALPGLGWTGLRVFANYSILEYWQPRCLIAACSFAEVVLVPPLLPYALS